MGKWISIISLVILAGSFSSCGFLFGEKGDETVDEIFEQGAIDPNLIPDQVGYVPIFPFWEGFVNPVDVYVAYDEMVYVVDDNGVHILDQKGEEHRLLPIPGATDVIMDRRLHLYVAGRINIDADGDGLTENLAAVYRIVNASTANNWVIVDTLIHPFADISRNNSAYRPTDDPEVKFTGLATLDDNTLYVSRTGPRNSLSSVARPDNTVLVFDEEGNNTGYTSGLNPNSSSLKSVLGLSSINTFAAPPQAVNGISSSRDFLITQTDESAEYKALWIRQINDPDLGITYTENSSLVSFDTEKADRFLYEPFRFENPADIYVAPDATGYIFIVDAGLDSLYQFTRRGFEGVNPPPNSTETKQILASFGGPGNGPFEFNEPSGVCYFKQMVYVADKGNGRVSRFRLSTDLE